MGTQQGDDNMRGYTVDELIVALENFRSIVEDGGSALVITDEYSIVGDLDVMITEFSNTYDGKRLFCVLYYADLDIVGTRPYSFENTIEDGDVEFPYW